jgi:hypothetical protein
MVILSFTIGDFLQQFLCLSHFAGLAPPPTPLSAKEYTLVHFRLLEWQNNAGKFSCRSFLKKLGNAFVPV